MTLNKYAKRKKKVHQTDPYVPVTVYLPRSVFGKLTSIADSKSITVERLLTRLAFLNHTDQSNFELNLNIMDIQMGGSSDNDRMLLWQFLNYAGDKGLELDVVLMAFDEIGLLSYMHAKHTLIDMLYLGLIHIVENDDGYIPKIAVTNPLKAKTRDKKFNLFAGVKVNGRKT